MKTFYCTFIALLVSFCSCVQEAPLDWPDKVYHLVSIDSVEEVPTEMLEVGGSYLILSQSYLPQYVECTESGSIEELIRNGSLDLPRKDSVTLRVICTPEDLAYDAMTIQDMIEYTQDEIYRLFIGKKLILQIDTTTIQTIPSTRDPSTLDDNWFQTNMPCYSNEIRVLIHPHFTRASGRPDIKLIKINKDALYISRYLLHELGHVFGIIGHPLTCCNLCGCYRDHFMHNEVPIGDQIMFVDWLKIIGACDAVDFCNSCNRDLCTPAERDIVAQVSGTLGQIEYPVDEVFLDSLSFTNAERVYDRLGLDEVRIRNFYKTEYKILRNRKPGWKIDEQTYVSVQMDAHRSLRYERFAGVLQRRLGRDTADTRYFHQLIETARRSKKERRHEKFMRK